jgi:hypothetical protein
VGELAKASVTRDDHQPPIVRPQQGDHRPYLRADMSPCCAKHHNDFTSRNWRIKRFVIDLTRTPEPNPAVSPQARAYIAERRGPRPSRRLTATLPQKVIDDMADCSAPARVRDPGLILVANSLVQRSAG